MTILRATLGRRGMLAGAGALVAGPALAADGLLLRTAAPAISDDAPSDKASGLARWFAIAPETARFWRVSAVPDDPFRAIVRPRTAGPSQRLFRVMVLYPRQSSAYDVAISKILNVFAAKGIVAELTIINYRNDQQRGQFAVGVAATSPADLIFSMGSESTAWLWANYRNGRIPIVTVCSKDPVLLGQATSYERGSGTNFAFTSLNVPIDVQMSYVAKLRPNLRNLAILVDNTNVSAVETQSKPIAEYARARGVQVFAVGIQEPLNVRDELDAEVAAAVAQMQKNDPLLDNSLFYVTGSTILFQEMGTVNARSSRVPILSAVPEVVQAGDDSATLSIGVSFESNAHLAAIYAVEVMTGRARIGELRVGVVSPPDIAISFRKARGIGLKIPFGIFESANNVYDYEGRLVREDEVVALAR